MDKKYVIGLGKMGLNLVKNFNDHDVAIIGHDINSAIELEYQHPLFHFSKALPEFSNHGQNLVMLLLPSGIVTSNMIEILSNRLYPNDLVIDFSNTHYSNSLEYSERLKRVGVRYFDCGLSGGCSGAKSGACMMLGNSTSDDNDLHELLRLVCRTEGFQYYEKVGSGHYLKMVHNGIEYAMMQAIAEGLQMLELQPHYHFDLYQVVANWSDGSIIQSFLLDKVKEALIESRDLSQYNQKVFASGEANWMIKEAIDLGIPVPTISQSLMIRSQSQIENLYGNRVLSAMRNKFGGHNEK